MTHAIGRMAEAIDCELLVDELAFSVRLSPSRFAYLFRRDTGRYHGVPPTGLRRRSWAALDWSGQRNPPINTPNGS